MLSLALALLISTFASGKETTIFRFDFTHGAYPESALVADGQGNLYGVTNGGGHGCAPDGCGVIFELSPGPGGKWIEQVLYAFNGKTDGGIPVTNLIFDAKGNLYGGVVVGGTYKNGGIFELSPGANGTWTEQLVCSFLSQDGFSVGTQLAVDRKGNFYGTLRYGGPDASGTVFEVSQSNGVWTATLIYVFTDVNGDGASPMGGVVLDRNGNVYGTTSSGGASTLGPGTAYELSPNGKGGWTESIIHQFAGNNDGYSPEAPLTIDASGNLYGTTMFQGADGGGTAFELSQVGGQWSETLLYSFAQFSGDGALPWGGLVLAANGNLYGATYYGGNGCNGGGCGTVYQLTPHAGGAWTETILHNFESALDGSESSSGLLVDSKGERLFGVTEYGGSMYGYGTVFVIQE